METISFGHGISVTPLQATATYAALVNGGYYIKPYNDQKEKYKIRKKIVSEKTSKQINKILRNVGREHGTASLADIYGYEVGGKTGTSENYKDKKNNMNTFISIFPSNDPKYVF